MPRGKRPTPDSDAKTRRRGGADNPGVPDSSGPQVPSVLPEWNWTIGTVVSTFGRFGELRVRYETDFPERFETLKRVCLRPASGAPKLFDVQRTRPHKGHVLVKLAGVESIDDAEVWRGGSVQVPREEAVPLPEDTYYAADLVGMDVVTADGRSLGKLERILPYPAHHLLQMGDILIPAVKEIVVEVDTARRRIVVAPPAGLLPGDEPETVDAA